MNNHKAREKTIVTEERLISIAHRVIRAAKAHFGRDLLRYSDDRWIQEINPWIDRWVAERYIFAGAASKAELDDVISIELENNGEEGLRSNGKESSLSSSQQ